jgi:hypothetical protein
MGKLFYLYKLKTKNMSDDDKLSFEKLQRATQNIHSLKKKPLAWIIIPYIWYAKMMLM